MRSVPNLKTNQTCLICKTVKVCLTSQCVSHNGMTNGSMINSQFVFSSHWVSHIRDDVPQLYVFLSWYRPMYGGPKAQNIVNEPHFFFDEKLCASWSSPRRIYIKFCVRLFYWHGTYVKPSYLVNTPGPREPLF